MTNNMFEGDASRAPREEAEQIALMQWAQLRQGKWPELKLLYHIPNEGKRTRSTGGRLVAAGLKRGLPDNHLPVARGGYIGLYIELKRADRRLSRVSAEQRKWMEQLSAAGHRCVVAYGWEEAAREIEAYMTMTEEDRT